MTQDIDEIGAARIKFYTELPRVTAFMAQQTQDVQDEYLGIVDKLEKEGRLQMPFGEKIKGKNLFAIRVINAGNVRVFYVYGKNDRVFGISGYQKTTRTIPRCELKLARKISKALKKEGVI